ncbi:hypothetical protein D3C76_1549870 [compost metagenome]
MAPDVLVAELQKQHQAILKRTQLIAKLRGIARHNHSWIAVRVLKVGNQRVGKHGRVECQFNILPGLGKG